MSHEKIDFDTVPYEFLQVKDTDLLEDDFASDEKEFTDYYHIDALQDVRERLVRMYILKINGAVLGYVTLAMAHIRNDATEEIKNKEVNGTIPALLISHLAVRQRYERRGIGTALLKNVFGYLVPELHTRAGCRYVVLNPRDDAGVRSFYKSYGFDYYDKFLRDGTLDKTSDAFLYDLKKKA